MTIQTYLQAVPPDDRQCIRRLTRRALRTGETPTVAHRIFQPDRSDHVVELTGVVIEDDPTGRPRGVISTVLDVTELPGFIAGVHCRDSPSRGPR